MGAPATGPRAPRVVLDTNVVLQGLVFTRGTSVALRQACQAARFTPLASQATAAELIRVLAYPKFRLSPEEQQDLLGDSLPYCETVRMPNPPPATPLCRDPLDTPFLELALAGKADFLVTGDRDLLALAGVLTCPIVNAEAFLRTLEST